LVRDKIWAQQNTDIKRFYEILLDNRLDNIHINELNENMLQIDYKYKGCYVENDFNTNIFIAAFTTANARLRLYEMLDKLRESVVYYDTDNIVYIDNGKNTVKTMEVVLDPKSVKSLFWENFTIKENK
jgi:hypothetical protein